MLLNICLSRTVPGTMGISKFRSIIPSGQKSFTFEINKNRRTQLENVNPDAKCDNTQCHLCVFPREVGRQIGQRAEFLKIRTHAQLAADYSLDI